MKILNRLLPIALLLVASNALAQSFPKDKVRQIEQNSIEVAQRYAERTVVIGSFSFVPGWS